MSTNNTIEDINVRTLTPMMKHWYSVKKAYPEHLLAYRMGDFYEFFYDDAIKVSRLLGITLTRRKIGNDSYPLAGIPHHAGSYLKNLINLGETVVVVEQLEDPTTVKGRIVKRGVVRIISPGTVIESDMLNSNENNYICSIVKTKKGYGTSFADLSTGEFITTEFQSKNHDSLEKLLSIYSRFDPVEVIIPVELRKDDRLLLLLTDLNDAIIKTRENYVFEYEEAYHLILRHFNLANLDGFGLEGKELAIQAAGGLLAFLKETQRDVIPNIFRISLFKEKDVLHLDYVTQRNLELISSLWEKGKDTTLYSVFNKTHTPMGARLLKKVILQPLTDEKEINRRLNIVQKFKEDIFLRSDLRENLKVIGDLERFINRINYSNNSNARDLVNIKNSLENIPKIKDLLAGAKIPEIEDYLSKINDFHELRKKIEVSIKDDPPTTIKEGNIIRDRYDPKIDELRDLILNGKKYVLEYENEQKKKWNLTSGLKIGHNNILGYYIEITLRTLRYIPELPDDYSERQTLKNAKRFTTETLKKLEDKIVDAEEQINELEYDLFCTIRDDIVKKTTEILETSRNIAFIDVLASFAEIAENYNYCRPKINAHDKVIIKDGRHPVVEQLNISEQFIPNDCYLDTETDQVLIITGPNMAGKSTYLRQVALICLIAQMGSFIPAKSATIGIIDQIFTRIGASDDLARRLSTFMIEMTETAKILNYTTQNSLIIIDELGRGTSTSDGQSIAMASLEKLHALKAKTLFSTHYHQLTELKLPRVKNYHLDIIENDDGSINFVRKLREGSTDKSYGIHVAKLAGLPDDVIMRAFEILDQIEKRDPFKATVKQNGNNNVSSKIYERFLSEKRQEIERLESLLDVKSKELTQIQETIDEKEKNLANLDKKLAKGEIFDGKTTKSVPSESRITLKQKKQKNYVQTTFFRPEIIEKSSENDELNELGEILKELDINSMTPLDAIKLLSEFKEKLARAKHEYFQE